MTPTRRWPRAWLYGVLPLVGVIELGLGLRTRTAAPTTAQYEALEPAVAAMFQEGDLVVVAPRWAEPHVRRALGDRFFPLEALARSDERRFRRAVEISALGERSPALASFRETERRTVGELELRVLENPRFEPLTFDFVAGMERRWASAYSSHPRAECAWTDRGKPMTGGLGGHPAFPPVRLECPESPYLNVSRTVIADQDFLPRRCIWAHPPATGERIVRFSGVPLGQRIVGHGGMYWIIERERRGARVDLEVRVDGEPIGRLQHQDGEGWKGFDLPLGAHAHAPRATVEFAVSSPDFVDRHFCFQADSR